MDESKFDVKINVTILKNNGKLEVTFVFSILLLSNVPFSYLKCVWEHVYFLQFDEFRDAKNIFLSIFLRIPKRLFLDFVPENDQKLIIRRHVDLQYKNCTGPNFSQATAFHSRMFISSDPLKIYFESEE